MKRYERRAALLWTILAVAGLGLLIASLCLEQRQMPWVVGLFLAVCLAVQILLYRTARDSMRELVVQLSDLIDQLTQLRQNPVFPTLEDTVLSRLQQQVERLASIWAGLNRQAKRERDEIQSLVSDLSHQLKTPVATLQIYVSLLSQPELSLAQRQEYGSRMQRALERLDFLLDSMVKLSRLESGSIRLQPRITEVEELVLNAALQVRRAAESKEINLSRVRVPAVPHNEHDRQPHRAYGRSHIKRQRHRLKAAKGKRSARQYGKDGGRHAGGRLADHGGGAVPGRGYI